MEEKAKIKTIDSLSATVVISACVGLIFVVLKTLSLRADHATADIIKSSLPKYSAIVLALILSELIMRFIAGAMTVKTERKGKLICADLIYLTEMLIVTAFVTAAIAACPHIMQTTDLYSFGIYVSELAMVILYYIFFLGFLRHNMMYSAKQCPDGNKLLSAVILTMSLLMDLYIVCLLPFLFVRRTGGGYIDWAIDMGAVLVKEDYIFSSRFKAVPIKAAVYKNAFMEMTQNKLMTGTALSPLGLYIIANCLPILKGLCEAVKERFNELKELLDLKGKWSALAERILSVHRKIAAPPKGYCMTCKRRRPLYLMLPYGVNTLDIDEDDIVENAVERQKAMLRKRSAMDLEKYSIKTTILKTGTKIRSKSGAKVSAKYCCAECYSTVYAPLAKWFADTQKIINISLIGDRNTAKTCFCASTAKAYPNMMLKNTPEYVYFRTFTERLEDRYPCAPRATPSDMIASPVLTIRYDGHIVGITDIAGENFAQAADTVRRDDVIGLFIRADDPESIASAYSVLAQLSYKMPLIVICITRADELEYYEEIYEAMSMDEDDLRKESGRTIISKKIGKDDLVRSRSEKLYDILSNNNDEFDVLFSAAQQHADRVEIAAHCALGTSVDKDLFLEGDYAPEFIDETLDALCSKNNDR